MEVVYEILMPYAFSVAPNQGLVYAQKATFSTNYPH
jgi:hypothetical protein